MGKTSLKVALYLAFIVCLYVSIPHLAWVFHSWESGATDTPLDLGVFGFNLLNTSHEWFNAYLQAMSIDVIIAFLSITLTNSKERTQTGIGYTFVTLLILISWFFNWLYSKEHAPRQGTIWNHVELVGLIHLGTVTPIITSALPVFALAFTIMIDKLTGAKITAEELRQQADDMEAINTEMKRIASIKRTKNVDGATSLIDAGAKVFGHVKSKVKKQSPNNSQPQLTSPVEPLTATENTNGVPQENEFLATERDTDKLNGVPLMSDETDPEIRSQKHPLSGMGGRATVTIEDAANMIGCQMKYVRTLRNRGKLKASPRNNELLTVASVKSYIVSREKGNSETQESDAPLQLHAVQ